jgi:hypothetical protein
MTDNKDYLPIGTVDKSWEIMQDDVLVVAADCKKELEHYAWQYLQDGDIEIWEVKRTLKEIRKA